MCLPSSHKCARVSYGTVMEKGKRKMHWFLWFFFLLMFFHHCCENFCANAKKRTPKLFMKTLKIISRNTVLYVIAYIVWLMILEWSRWVTQMLHIHWKNMAIFITPSTQKLYKAYMKENTVEGYWKWIQRPCHLSGDKSYGLALVLSILTITPLPLLLELDDKLRKLNFLGWRWS